MARLFRSPLLICALLLLPTLALADDPRPVSTGGVWGKVVQIKKLYMIEWTNRNTQKIRVDYTYTITGGQPTKAFIILAPSQKLDDKKNKQVKPFTALAILKTSIAS